ENASDDPFYLAAAILDLAHLREIPVAILYPTCLRQMVAAILLEPAIRAGSLVHADPLIHAAASRESPGVIQRT
ncbi:Hypothetical predicted protein, partial [Pelobates cultripes]